MQQLISYDKHFVRMICGDRERFGYVSRIDGTALPFMEAKEFLFEVLDETARMPVAMVEAGSVRHDYGGIAELVERGDCYVPWLRRLVQSDDMSAVTSLRAILIATGELALQNADVELLARLHAAQAQFGLDADAWSDEALQIAIQLSRNEEGRSIQEIEGRARLAKLIADRINSEQSERS